MNGCEPLFPDLELEGVSCIPHEKHRINYQDNPRPPTEITEDEIAEYEFSDEVRESDGLLFRTVFNRRSLRKAYRQMIEGRLTRHSAAKHRCNYNILSGKDMQEERIALHIGIAKLVGLTIGQAIDQMNPNGYRHTVRRIIREAKLMAKQVP